MCRIVDRSCGPRPLVGNRLLSPVGCGRLLLGTGAGRYRHSVDAWHLTSLGLGSDLADSYRAIGAEHPLCPRHRRTHRKQQCPRRLRKSRDIRCLLPNLEDRGLPLHVLQHRPDYHARRCVDTPWGVSRCPRSRPPAIESLGIPVLRPRHCGIVPQSALRAPGPTVFVATAPSRSAPGWRLLCRRRDGPVPG